VEASGFSVNGSVPNPSIFVTLMLMSILFSHTPPIADLLAVFVFNIVVFLNAAVSDSLLSPGTLSFR
jgi:hypothetical protein